MQEARRACRRGDLWSERWREEVTERGPVKWAEKKGENAQGERWYETWLEENEAKKQAKKAGGGDALP